MYQNINEQFTTAARQFADSTSQISRLALENTQKAFGLQLATFEQNATAAFSFWGELAEVRDAEGLKAAWPKGAQIARESIERSVSTGQEVFGQTVATNEAIAQLAKGQVEAAAAKAQDTVDGAVKAASGKSRK